MKACLFLGDRLILAQGSNDLPSLGEARGWRAEEAEWVTVNVRNATAMAAQASGQWKLRPGLAAVGMRAVLPLLSGTSLQLALTAAHLMRWRRTSRHCGVCGAATRPSRRHQAMRCPECGHLAFPKVSPAVIVQVTRGNRILLGRSRRHPAGGYSVLAGFVNPGESLEDAVRREIREEAGIAVGDVRYFGSQPWPFPDSLMVGFTAVHQAGKVRSLDDELEDVAWFGVGEMPPIPPSYSIARTLIDDFVTREGGHPAALRSWFGNR